MFFKLKKIQVLTLIFGFGTLFSSTILAADELLDTKDQPFISSQQMVNDDQNAEQWNIHTGGYIEGNVGTNFLKFFDFGSPQGKFFGHGENINFGYMFGPHWGTEGGVGYSDMGTDGKEDLNVYSAFAAIRFNIPIENKFALIAKLGATYMYVVAKEDGHDKTSDTNDKKADVEEHILPYIGAGISYAITPKLSLNVQCQTTYFFFGAFNLVSAGLTYHF